MLHVFRDKSKVVERQTPRLRKEHQTRMKSWKCCCLGIIHSTCFPPLLHSPCDENLGREEERQHRRNFTTVALRPSLPGHISAGSADSYYGVVATIITHHNLVKFTRTQYELHDFAPHLPPHSRVPPIHERKQLGPNPARIAVEFSVKQERVNALLHA
nr:hypothetical protein CFP56_29853 [Quercus suber]